MPKFIADFHIHSKYSRATSPDMDLAHIAKWAGIKGIDLIGTGDFTHPIWLAELKAKLEPTGNGLNVFRNVEAQNFAPLQKSPQFILTAEISNIFLQRGRTRKIHNLIIAPSFEVVGKINSELAKHGRLDYDGRPIFGFPLTQLCDIVFGASPDCLIIPCHAWTPHFAVFGSNSGFDSLDEAFGKYSKEIHAIETGMSSDPAMNWRLSALDNLTFISNSDAHSPPKLGREATVFDCEMTYKDITEAIKKKDKKKILYTIEFFPEEGKYHFDGHRKCGICWSPEETHRHHGLCSVCLKPITVGVMHRVDKLADRPVGFVPDGAIPFKSIVPLPEILGEVLGKGPATKAVNDVYFKMIETLGNEFSILLEIPLNEIVRAGLGLPTDRIAEAITKMRAGDLSIAPGHDGEYGTVSIWERDDRTTARRDAKEQMGLF